MTDWKYKIFGINVAIHAASEGEISNNEAIARIGDKIAQTRLYKKAVEASAKMEESNDQEDLITMVEEMQWAREDDDPVDTDYFNAMLSGMYDWADRELVWIEPVAAIA